MLLSEYNKVIDERNQLRKENASLKEENVSLWNDNKRYQKMIAEFQDKVSRRNMQIKDLEKKLADVIVACESGNFNTPDHKRIWKVRKAVNQ